MARLPTVLPLGPQPSRELDMDSVYDSYSRFSARQWLQQARAHVMATRALAATNVAGGQRQLQLAREARSRAKQLMLAHALVKWAASLVKVPAKK